MKTITQSSFYCLGVVCQSSVHAFITHLSAASNCLIRESQPLSISSTKLSCLQSQKFTGTVGDDNTDISIIPINPLNRHYLSLPSGIDFIITLDTSEQKSNDPLKHILKKHKAR